MTGVCQFKRLRRYEWFTIHLPFLSSIVLPNQTGLQICENVLRNNGSGTERTDLNTFSNKI